MNEHRIVSLQLMLMTSLCLYVCLYVQVKTKARLTQKVIEMESALAESKAEAGTALNMVSLTL